jgi:hypothetical protein
VAFDRLAEELPTGTRRVSPIERAEAIDIRRKAVSRRFAR